MPLSPPLVLEIGSGTKFQLFLFFNIVGPFLGLTRNLGARQKLRGITNMTSKKGTSFQKAHTLDFAFEIVLTYAHGDVTIWCLFCLYQGRDVVEVGVAGRKCKQRNDIKYFTKSLSPFKYRSHHEGQHATSWTEYQGMSVDQK
jgi:hypothetical protein